MLHAVSEAISTQIANRMNKTGLVTITDTQWEEAGGWSTSVSVVSIKPKQWQHFAIVNDSANDVIKMFLDGNQVGVNEVAVSISDIANATLRIGDNGSSNPEWIGNIDEFKISKGTARWTQNFAPPERPSN